MEGCRLADRSRRLNDPALARRRYATTRSTRENLSRSLALLTEHGVRIRGREIVIDSEQQLEAFARPQRFIDDPTS